MDRRTWSLSMSAGLAAVAGSALAAGSGSAGWGVGLGWLQQTCNPMQTADKNRIRFTSGLLVSWRPP
jgi:hypothetical protein